MSLKDGKICSVSTFTEPAPSFGHLNPQLAAVSAREWAEAHLNPTLKRCGNMLECVDCSLLTPRSPEAVDFNLGIGDLVSRTKERIKESDLV